MTNNSELMVIIPCFNEEKSIQDTILSVHKSLSKQQIVFGIIIINDGSTDNSGQEIEKVSNYVEIINLPKNHGYGYAIKQGLKAVKTPWTAIIDADLTYNPEDLLKLWKERDKSNMIVGSRIGKKVYIPFLRRPMKYFLKKFASWLMETSIPDLNSGIRIFKTSDALKFFHLYPDSFSFTTTITMSFLSSNLDVQFVPISYNKRKGKSKIRPLHDSYQFLLLLIKLTIYYNPLKVFLPTALFLFVISLISIAYDVFIIKNLGDKSILFIMLSLLTFLLGLIADLIIKRTQS